MNNKIHPHPLSFSDKKKIYPDLSPFKDKDKLESELRNRGLNINLGNLLVGGVMSQVYEAKLDGSHVVVKHTEDRGEGLFSPPFSPYDFFLSRESGNMDTLILKKLAKSAIKVPHVLNFFPDIFTTILSDLRDENFVLMMSQIINKNFDSNSAENLGKNLALLNQEMKKWEPFETVESAEQQIYQRGMELRLFYMNTQEHYKELEAHYCKKGQYIWTDGHPKNILTDPDGQVAFIDFGRTHLGDKDYVLPNFLAHITIYGLAGYIKKRQTLEYFDTAFAAYSKIEGINEELFCKYLGMEILHRSSGKWISGIDTRAKKLRNIEFGMTIFDTGIKTPNQILKLLDKFLS
jgi:hypothetical protein